MNDYTAAVIRLENAYSSMQIARKRVADEVRAEFQRAIRDEITRRQHDIEHEFARELRLESERGLPGSVIRAEVLRTQDWGRWKKWRDLADIEPERVTIRNAKEEREAERERATRVFEWRDGVLYVHRNPATKQALPHVVAYPLYNAKGSYVPYYINDLSALGWLVGDRDAGIRLAFAVTDEIKRAFAEGKVTVSTSPYDYVNDLDPELRDEYLSTEDNKFIAANPWLDDYQKGTNA